MAARAPSEAALLMRQASQLHQQGRLGEAEALYRAVLEAAPGHPGALHFLGVLSWQRGQTDTGLELIERALRRRPDDTAAEYNRANILCDLGRESEALEGFARVLAQNPDHQGALTNSAAAFFALGKHEEAVAACNHGLKLRPGDPGILINRANALTALKRNEEALADYDAALRAAPGDASALYGRGNALLALERPAEALASYDRALVLKPGDPDLLGNRGIALVHLRRYDEAIASLDSAITARPDNANAHLDRANAYVDLGRHAVALADYDRALALNPDLPAAHYGRGYALIELKRPEEAIAAFEALLRLDPDYPYARGMLLYAKRNCCDWRGDAEAVAKIAEGIRAGKRVTTPLMLLVSDSAADKLRCAQILMQDKCPASVEPLWRGEPYRHDRIRVAYLSADLRNHAVATLAAGVFEHHDTNRFETAAFSYGVDDGSAMRARLIRAFGRFHDVRAESDVRVASMVRAWEADIIVDLTGLTGPGRPGILAQRPAPVQVNWLGFAGSMGAPFVDYLLADAIAIPVSEQPHYQEWLALLPHCYLPHDSARVIAPAPLRQAAGLPARVFVFASFNNAYKFTPDVFAVWMRLLARVPKSVLWLPQPNEAARRNLRAQAQTHGIDPDRIVFAPYAPRPEDHLARLSLADLFLDTLPYNSHSTAVDALFAGVPIVTCIGESFAGRVAASALTAAGLPDLVTGSQDAYEALALALATDAPRLAAIRERLLGARATAPLFDSAGFTCDLEAAYTTMCERARRGLPPAPFAVPATRGSAP